MASDDNIAKGDDAVRQCQRVRQFEGPPIEFWSEYLKCCAELVGAHSGVTLLTEGEAARWSVVDVYPDTAKMDLTSLAMLESFKSLADDAFEHSCSTGQIELKGTMMTLLGQRLILPESQGTAVALFLLPEPLQQRPTCFQELLQLMADAPLVYQLRRSEKQARTDVVRFSETLDISIVLNQQTRYMAAAMVLCNEIATRYGADRVSLGWVVKGYVRLQAISHIEKFEPKMDSVQDIEKLMEEALGQDEELLLPRPADSSSILREHEAFAQKYSENVLATFPVRLDGVLVAALCCERHENDPFSDEQVQAIALIADQAARRLSDLRQQDRWWGARAANSTRKCLGRLVGVEDTWSKLTAMLVALLLAFVLFGQWDYRVEAPFMIKTDAVSYLPAPFDGYIDQVHVEVGDLVQKGDPLLSLDRRELLLEESNAAANKVRYDREAQKAEATNALSEMKIAQALSAQAQTELELVRYHLENAQLKAAFDGVIVEGDLEEMLGAPVRKGDVLFKLARLDEIYVQLDVDEKDVHHIVQHATGEISFVSQPKHKYPITVARIDPVAVAKEDGNRFMVRGELLGELGNWWRPGMSGIAKVNAGQKNIAWIIGHRTVDFLRLFFWW